MRWDRARTGVMALAVTVATVAGAGAHEATTSASIGMLRWTVGHQPVKCGLAAEVAPGPRLAPVRAVRRSDDARHRVRDTGDISIDDWNNGIRSQSADRFGSAAALGALSSVGGQQVTGTFTRVGDHDR